MARKICEVKGEGKVEIHAAQIWFRRFKDVDTSLEDKPRYRCPFVIDSEALREAVEDDSSTITRRLSSELGASQSTVVRHLLHIFELSFQSLDKAD